MEKGNECGCSPFSIKSLLNASYNPPIEGPSSQPASQPTGRFTRSLDSIFFPESDGTFFAVCDIRHRLHRAILHMPSSISHTFHRRPITLYKVRFRCLKRHFHSALNSILNNFSSMWIGHRFSPLPFALLICQHHEAANADKTQTKRDASSSAVINNCAVLNILRKSAINFIFIRTFWERNFIAKMPFLISSINLWGMH